MNLRDLQLGRQHIGTFEFTSDRITANDEGSVVTIKSTGSDGEALVTLPDGRTLLVTTADQDTRDLIEEVVKLTTGKAGGL